ncbi:hypothetical protein E5288_WYG021348 [Bos mutus]|uniref:Uncharacterized protein n=1 Tax=Bos mutus TaxID=72004 RepID=A0A6B0RDQ6_9CETA|nr:hypothetical protein [Bos mutus]
MCQKRLPRQADLDLQLQQDSHGQKDLIRGSFKDIGSPLICLYIQFNLERRGPEFRYKPVTFLAGISLLGADSGETLHSRGRMYVAETASGKQESRKGPG